MGEIRCPVCGEYFKSLGYASHRTKHYNERQRKKEQEKKDEN